MEQQGMPKAGRDFSLTLIQVVCAVSVVTLHTNGCFWNFSATEHYWFTANIIECLFYFAVCVFFMISGITLLDYREKYTTKVFFRKRFEKAFLPYIVWSLIAVAYGLSTHSISLETIDVKWILEGLLDGTLVSFYWFFPSLFCVYLCVPVFSLISKEKKKEAAEYILAIGMVVNMLPVFLNNVFQLGFTWPYHVDVASSYLFWIWLGYYLYHYPPERKWRWVIYFLAVCGLMMHIAGTYILSVEAGSIQRTYKGYNNVPCVLYSSGVFLFLREIAGKAEKNRVVRKMFQIMGKYTFPLYLMHWFVLTIAETIFHFNQKSLLYRLLMPYPVFAVVIAATWIMRKIPLVRKIVP